MQASLLKMFQFWHGFIKHRIFITEKEMSVEYTDTQMWFYDYTAGGQQQCKA